jgi:hypothetical protein
LRARGQVCHRTEREHGTNARFLCRCSRKVQCVRAVLRGIIRICACTGGPPHVTCLRACCWGADDWFCFLGGVSRLQCCSPWSPTTTKSTRSSEAVSHLRRCLDLGGAPCPRSRILSQRWSSQRCRRLRLLTRSRWSLQSPWWVKQSPPPLTALHKRAVHGTFNPNNQAGCLESWSQTRTQFSPTGRRSPPLSVQLQQANKK